MKSIEYLYENIDIFENEIPVGTCNGDLTIYNMLVDYNNKQKLKYN